MNILDIIILCTLVFFVVQGIFRGFLREIASLAGVVLGIFLGSRFQPEATALFKTHVVDFHYLPVASFVLIFTMVLVACNIFGYAMSVVFRNAFLGWMDRGLGVWLALTKGVIFTFLIITVLTFSLPPKAPLMVGSRLAPWVVFSYHSMLRVISPEQYEKWKSRILGNEKKATTWSPGTLNRKNEQKRTGQSLP